MELPGDVDHGSSTEPGDDFGSWLVAASQVEWRTPRERFGETVCVYDRVHQTPAGVYLMVVPGLGPHDPVAQVGWARNDYWAVQVWGFNGNAFRNEKDRDEPGVAEPSLETLGWPYPLRYGETLKCAQLISGHRAVVSASYRGTDGALVSHVIRAAARLVFHYGDANPGPTDTPVAIEFGLTGPRWEQHLAQIRTYNEARFGSSNR